MRQLVKETTGLDKQAIISKPLTTQNTKKVAIASNMIEYYNGENIGVGGKDAEHEIIVDSDVDNSRSIIFSLLLIDKENMHINVTSDFEIKRCEGIFASMIRKSDECHEAYFGLGKILFFKNEIPKAVEMLQLAIELFGEDPVYCFWAAIAQFYLYKRCERHSVRKRDYAAKTEHYANVCIKYNKKDTNALFIMLNLVIDIDNNKDVINLVPKYHAQDLAVMIKEADCYKGYIAWAYIYIARGSVEFAVDVLEELIQFYPSNIEAYFKLWSMKRSKPEEAMEVADKMFLSCTNFYTLETK
jgi:hypothetical protein